MSLRVPRRRVSLAISHIPPYPSTQPCRQARLATAAHGRRRRPLPPLDRLTPRYWKPDSLGIPNLCVDADRSIRPSIHGMRWLTNPVVRPSTMPPRRSLHIKVPFSSSFFSIISLTLAGYVVDLVRPYMHVDRLGRRHSLNGTLLIACRRSDSNSAFSQWLTRSLGQVTSINSICWSLLEQVIILADFFYGKWKILVKFWL